METDPRAVARSMQCSEAPPPAAQEPRTRLAAPLATRLGLLFVLIGLTLIVAELLQVAVLGWFLPSLAFLGAFGAAFGAIMWLVPGRTPETASTRRSDDLAELVRGLGTVERVTWAVGLVVAGLGGWLFVRLLAWLVLEGRGVAAP